MNPKILKIILLGAFIGCIYGSLEEYTALFIRDTGAENYLIPIIEAFIVAGAVVASLVAQHYEKLRNSGFMILLGASGIALMAAGSLTGLGAWLLVVAYTFLIKLLNVIFDAKLQHSIQEGSLRATVTSVNGFVLEVLSIATYFVFGVVANYAGTAGAFKLIGAVVVLTALLYLAAAPRLINKDNFA